MEIDVVDWNAGFVTRGGCGGWWDQVFREVVCWAQGLGLYPETKGGGQFQGVGLRSNTHTQSLVLEKLSQSSELGLPG